MAVVCVGTAFASPEARQLVTSAWGTVARAVGLVSSADPPSPPPTAPRRHQDSPQVFDRSPPPNHPDVASATTNIDPPSSPAALTAVASSSTQIDLAWTDVGTETGYRVERSADGATDWVTVATTGQDVSAYSDTGLSPGATYYYRVFATNAGGDSPASDVASATTNIDPPSSPAALTAVASSSTQIDLAWTDVGTETGYRVERSADGATDWVTVATTGQDVSAYSDTGLSPGATYYYRVFATNAGGDSPASDVASATTSID